MKYDVQPTERTNFQNLQKKLEELATSKPGCKIFKLHEDFKNPSCFWLIEEWESVASWKPYLLSADRATSVESMMAMVNGIPKVALYKVSNSNSIFACVCGREARIPPLPRYKEYERSSLEYTILSRV